MKRLLLISVVLAGLLSACEFSLAGDITPPPDAILSGEVTPAAIEYPSAFPDASNGALIYAARCAACHGLGGLGEGEQAGELPFAPAPIGNADLARSASPEDWYRVVTQGRIARFMPPFAAALTPQERWDVLAHVYSLSLDPGELARGAQLYAENQSRIAGVLDGVSPLSVKLETLGSLGLSNEDTTALVAYTQALALGLMGSGSVEVTAGPEPTLVTDATQTGSFSGHVAYGSAGSLPAGLQVLLSGFDHTEQVVSQTTDVSEDGSFSFEDVPLAEGRIFFAQIEYLGQTYFSEFLTAEGETTNFDIPITIYDTTSDTSQLAVETIQLVYDFSQAGIVRVVERVSISNLGDQAVVPDDGQPVLHFSLPVGAGNLAFEEGVVGDRYVVEPGGFGDLRGVLPGTNSYQMLFAYELPYSNSPTYQISIDLPTRSLVALLPESGFELQSEVFQLIGTQAIEGVDYAVYSADAGFFPGDEVPIAILGAHPAGGGGLAGILNDDSLVVGLASLTLAVGAIWLWLRSAQTPEQWMDAILALDARYKRGDISKQAYNRQRAALKAKLQYSLDKRSAG